MRGGLDDIWDELPRHLNMASDGGWMNGCNAGETALDTGVELSEDDKESLILGTGMHQWALKESKE